MNKEAGSFRITKSYRIALISFIVSLPVVLNISATTRKLIYKGVPTPEKWKRKAAERGEKFSRKQRDELLSEVSIQLDGEELNLSDTAIESVRNFYNQRLGEGNQLISNLTFFKETGDGLISEVFNEFANEDDGVARFSIFVGSGLANADKLVKDIVNAYYGGDKSRGKSYINHLSSLLEFLNTVKGKFSEKMRVFEYKENLEEDDVMAFGLLAEIAMSIVRYANWVAHFSGEFEKEDLSLRKNALNQFDLLVEKLENDIDAYARNILKIPMSQDSLKLMDQSMKLRVEILKLERKVAELR